MLALVLDGSPRLVPDYPEPSPAPGLALIALRSGGICDTDLQLLQGYLPFRGVLGHEFVGQVLASSSPKWLGKRVVADINAGCGVCPECLYHNAHHCPQRTVLGLRGRDGIFSERFLVPEKCLRAVPDSVPDDKAVFAEPLAAAAHVLDACPKASHAVVLGDGKLGLLITLALLAQARSVLLIGHHPEKLSIAERAGAQTVLSDNAEPTATELVVEATGSSQGLEQAIKWAAPRGTIVVKTTVAAPTSLHLAAIVVKELRLIGSRCGDLSQALTLLEQDQVDPRPLIAARYPLAQADKALQHAARPGALKVIVDGDGA